MEINARIHIQVEVWNDLSSASIFHYRLEIHGIASNPIVAAGRTTTSISATMAEIQLLEHINSHVKRAIASAMEPAVLQAEAEARHAQESPLLPRKC